MSAFPLKFSYLYYHVYYTAIYKNLWKVIFHQNIMLCSIWFWGLRGWVVNVLQTIIFNKNDFKKIEKKKK
jgi:hypothetical protein